MSFNFSARRILLAAGIALAASAMPGHAASPLTFRPPAVPLVTFDPYLSIWSEADHLTDENTRHWTRHEHPLRSLVRIDGKTYRLMGNAPREIPAFPQVSVQVLPTRSIYEFEDTGVHITLTFMTAALPNDLDALSRPLSYITWQVRSVDGAAHSVSVYDSVSSQLTVNVPTEQVTWARAAAGPLTTLRVGTVEQPVLGSAGDDHRINWGYAYLAAPAAETKAAIGPDQTLLESFAGTGTLPAADDANMPRATNQDQPVLAMTFDLGKVSAAPVARHAMVAYDEIYAIKYFRKNLRPYWRRNGAEPADMLQAAEQDYPSMVERCTKFDTELMADMTRVGGARYALVTAAAYRQCLAANGLAADASKQPLLFTKENTSNGDIATTDVFFPQDPIFVFLSPALAKASLVPILDYGASPRWKFPCAPHDLGTYPIARGTDDGGEAMPVEESGNMLILCDAIAKAEGNADFVTRWWPALTKWAAFLEQFGLDPENQLCTDDFMGHLAHNANLSVKAVVALAAYGDLCRMRGDTANAERYDKLARVDAQHWMTAAADGDHYRLAFDKPHTWSQKYNLVWDKLLGLNVFPPEVARAEIAHYKTVMQKYGLPLDSRTKLTKTDWSFWVATMAEKPEDFEGFIAPLYDYFNETTTRDPLSDSFNTDNVHSGGMHARPVIGGLFIKMLSDQATWKKWASADQQKVGNWAPLPTKPQVSIVVPTAVEEPQEWHYTTAKPAADWSKPDFDDKAWKTGRGAFSDAPKAKARINWRTDDIWIRRVFVMPEGNFSNLQFTCYHDEDVDIYINGVFAAREGGYNNSYEALEIEPAARALLKPGATITLAAHVHQTIGGQGVDIGLVNITEH